MMRLLPCAASTAAAMVAAAAAGSVADAAPVLSPTPSERLGWSDPVLVEGFTYHLPVPDHFYGFDRDHMYGMGFNGSWVFSRSAGKSFWRTRTPSNVPHGESPLLPVGPRSYRSLGGGLFPVGEAGWDLQWPRRYSLLPDGSGFTIVAASGGGGPQHNVSFTGVPYPGVNISAHALVKSGTRNYGVVRAANGRYVLQTDVLWNGLQPHETHGTSWVMLSIVSFTSLDGYSWRFGGVIANWSDVTGGNYYSDLHGDVLRRPAMWGPSEADVTLLSDNKTLLSVVRMDGDSGCFPADVPPHDRDSAHTTYRNYHASFSSDHGVSWSRPKAMLGTGCARPRLKRLDGGALLLTGGRLCVENMTGVFLWLNSDGMGGLNAPAGAAIGADVWQRHSITNQHNRLWKGDPKYRFSAMANDSSVFETLSYTSIVPTGPQSAVITYNKFDYEQIGRGNVSWPGPSANFAISVTVESATAVQPE
jgi:hypothetical protein